MSKIFISYKRADKDKVFKIKDKIESKLGEKCWVDFSNIESDEFFADTIVKAINKCDVFIFMYSKSHSKITNFQKDWTIRELYFAQEQEKHIVFVNIDGYKLIDLFKLLFPLQQIVDVSSQENIDKMINDIRGWLNPTSESLPLPRIRKESVLGNYFSKYIVYIIPLLFFISLIVVIYYFYDKNTIKSDKEVINKTWMSINKVPLFERKVDTLRTKEFIVNGVKFRMKFVEGGTLLLGNTLEQTDSVRVDESVEGKKNGHRVTITNSYWIGETEVTQSLWEAVMGKGNNPSQFNGPNLPVEKININDCHEFVKKLSDLIKEYYFCLPTEAEWEYAARGGENFVGYNYCGSDTLYKIAWYFQNSEKRPHEVAQLAPNELGIYDMSGNVYEWCEDFANRSFYTDDMINPCNTVPTDDRNLRVIRGGSWHSSSTSSCRVAFREYMRENARASSLGVRIVMKPRE